MGATSHQTVRLGRGRHRSPDDGACVMELASMLAGERFGDRPRCVDPVLAGFLRAFNDRLHARHRQRLFPYAALAVGTRGTRADARRRRDLCLAFLGHRRFGPVLRARLVLSLGFGALLRPSAGVGEWAARRTVREPQVGFALLDALVGREPLAAPAAAPQPEPAPV